MLCRERVRTAHVTIPDAVMNYDWIARENYQRLSDEWRRANSEPNRPPHPIDLMAIETLYETIATSTFLRLCSRVSLTTMFSSGTLLQVSFRAIQEGRGSPILLGTPGRIDDPKLAGGQQRTPVTDRRQPTSQPGFYDCHCRSVRRELTRS